MSALKISIITVCFNLIQAGREKTFRQCLESIHNQSYKHIEHIVVDGASTDGTLEIIKEYAAKGWIKYISEPDMGIYDAMNKGYRMAKGDYIGILNSDDYYHDFDGIRKIAEHLAGSRADYVYSNIAVVNPETGHKNIYKARIKNIFFYMSLPHPSIFIKKHIFNELQGYDTHFKIAGDYDFVLRMFLSGNYKGTEIPGKFLTFRNGGISEINLEAVQEEVAQVHRKNYQTLVKQHLDVATIVYMKYLPISVILALLRRNKVPKPYLFKQIIRFLKQRVRCLVGCCRPKDRHYG